MSVTSCKLICFVKSDFAKFTAVLFIISKKPASLKRNSLYLIFSMNPPLYLKKEVASHENVSLAKFMFKRFLISKSVGLCFVSIYLHFFMSVNFLISCTRFSTNISNFFQMT